VEEEEHEQKDRQTERKIMMSWAVISIYKRTKLERD
jgi:hypothetical protein